MRLFKRPGFIAYQVARTGDRMVASITVFHERDRAERSNELAAEWVAEALADSTWSAWASWAAR